VANCLFVVGVLGAVADWGVCTANNFDVVGWCCFDLGVGFAILPQP
jgi:hypothetical protein